MATAYINADAYRQRYGLTWEEYLNEDVEIVAITESIMQFENERRKLEDKRSERDSTAISS